MAIQSVIAVNIDDDFDYAKAQAVWKKLVPVIRKTVKSTQQDYRYYHNSSSRLLSCNNAADAKKLLSALVNDAEFRTLYDAWMSEDGESIVYRRVADRPVKRVKPKAGDTLWKEVKNVKATTRFSVKELGDLAIRAGEAMYAKSGSGFMCLPGPWKITKTCASEFLKEQVENVGDDVSGPDSFIIDTFLYTILPSTGKWRDSSDSPLLDKANMDKDGNIYLADATEKELIVIKQNIPTPKHFTSLLNKFLEEL